MSSTSDTKLLLVRLPPELAAQLDAKARAEDRSKSSFVRRAIQAALVDFPQMQPVLPAHWTAHSDGSDHARQR